LHQSVDSEFEATFAAAAHHLIACRFYGDAIQLLEVARRLQGRDASVETSAELLENLDAVRTLTARIYSGYPRAFPVEAPELVPFRRHLRRIERELKRELGRTRTIKITTVYDFFRLVQKRPAMYLDERSVRLLSTFLDGVRCGQPSWQVESPPFSDFRWWLGGRYPEVNCGGGHGWARFIIELVGEDGPEAWERFFKELRAYRRGAS